MSQKRGTDLPNPSKSYQIDDSPHEFQLDVPLKDMFHAMISTSPSEVNAESPAFHGQWHRDATPTPGFVRFAAEECHDLGKVMLSE